LCARIGEGDVTQRTSANNWLIRGGRIVDAATGRDAVGDLLVLNGMIAEVADEIRADGVAEIDACGLVVAPGLIDLHVHLREPGFEEKETIATGTAAAAAGGFTAICCMPNTKPALDSVAVFDDLAQRIARDAVVPVYPIAAITRARAGEEAVDFDALAAAGAIGFSDDGDTTADSAIMRRALEATLRHGRPVMVHCEDKHLAAGAMNEGVVSRTLGYAGIPSAAEEIIIGRDLELAALTGGWLHVCHVSTGRGIELIRQAKAAGVHVTAEAMPHHLVMTDEWVAGARRLVNVFEPVGLHAAPGDPNTKVNPPLRPQADAEALLAALIAGDFDIIATDHAPHHAAQKQAVSFEKAAMGMSGLEFALPTCLALVRSGDLTMLDLVQRLSYEPGKLLGKGGGSLQFGERADVVLFDPDEPWIVEAARLRTKSPNTPLLGMTLRGRVKKTLVNGEIRFDDKD
jgi:dihydroorotase